MKRRMCGLMFVAVICLSAVSLVAGTPTVTVYFDEALTMRSVDRLAPGLVTLYVVAESFDARLTAIEYKIDLPAGMTWVEDLDVPPVTIGTTEKGITQAWGEPLDGFTPVVVAKVIVQWDPKASSTGGVAVSPHPVFGFVRAAAAPDHRIIEAQGETSHLGERTLRGSEPALRSVTPNPFNPVTQITYWIPDKARVRLTVFDVTGQLVARLVNDVRDRGEHTFNWHADDLPSGVYFCRLEVGDFLENRKVMLLK